MNKVNDLESLKVLHRQAIDLAHATGDFDIRKIHLKTAARYAEEIAARELEYD